MDISDFTHTFLFKYYKHIRLLRQSLNVLFCRALKRTFYNSNTLPVHILWTGRPEELNFKNKIFTMEHFILSFF
jgi:hypothetical protein